MEEKRRDSAGTPPTTAVENLAPAVDQSTSSRRRGGGQKRKSTSINSGGGSSAPQTTSSKRQAREKPPVVPFPPIHINGPCTRARVHPNNSNNFSTAVAPVKMESEARDGLAKAEEMRGLSEDWEALEAKIETDYESIISRDANVHVVPFHAGWFSWMKIHSLEEKMLPSFFNGKSESRSPEIYMEIRNWIMKKFHLNPNSQVELKQLSELTVGDFDARQEVMEFLDYWGLINYHPFPQKEPAAMIADADEAGEKDSLIERLYRFETVQSWTPVVTWTNAEIPAMTSGLLPESVISEELVKSEGVEYHCNSCSADCSRKRYHCQKQADFDLCAECFNDGKFGSDMSPSDFILMEPAEAGGVSGGNWTDQETLLLLEAIELFRDNWSEIAEHVATKTKAQCILHFVQMPIEDAFFNCEDEKNENSKENGLPVTITTENSSPKADRNRDPALKDVPEKTESQGGAADNQDSSCPMEISNLEEVSDSDKSLEVRENFALTALKEAFEAVGSLSSPGERLSFAGAGNPVMTVAAFLVRLVEPNIATASVHSFLKALSGNHSGEELSARHCFRLEDPPDDKKNLADSAGAEIETIGLEAQKDENEHVEKQTQETPDSGIDGISVHDDNDENKDSVSEEHKGKKDTASEQKVVASTSNECASRSDALKEPNGMDTHEEIQPPSVSEPRESDFPKKQAPKDAEESAILASRSELQSNSVKESEDGASAGEPFQSKEPLKDEDLMSKSEKNETERLAVPNSMTEKEEITGDGEAKEYGSEKKDPLVTINELDIDKLKRAAMTALSAAAVKAKLLADQEEDQICQLAILLIEKQLHKLETKLAFFSDLENVVLRVKEQLDRSKQRLFHERAQIIATRLGMSASARPTSQLLPPNRAAATFPNPASRPLMGMNSFRPPISRPLMVSNPASTIPIPPNAAGSSMQPNADKLSSVGTK